MPFPLLQSHGTFSLGKKSATAGTVINHLIPPLRNQRGAALSSVGQSLAKPNVAPGVAHVTNFSYLIGTTAHVITVMRPLNYTWLTADAAASQAVVNVAVDPGTWQTAGVYQYALPGGLTAPSTANNAIAASDYVVYQAAAGQWVFDTVSSVSSLAITLSNNLPTGGAKAGSLFYFLGITTDTDPAFNVAHQQFDVDAAASGTARYTLQSSDGLWQAYHAGDPMLLQSSNGTTAGTFELLSGHYLSH